MIPYTVLAAIPIGIYLRMVLILDVPAECWFDVAMELVGRN